MRFLTGTRAQFRSSERGQALIVVALFFFLVFLVFAALAVDGTIIYLRRRQMQNMADAAVLAAAEYLGTDKNNAAAIQVAIDSLDENGTVPEWYYDDLNFAAPNPPSTNVGSGVDLIKGIEINGDCNVRVSLRWNDMGTYFTQFFGRQTLQVGAHAHAACNRAGGLVPIAVKRFGDERDWNMDLKNVNQANVYCDECDTQISLAGPPAQGDGNATEFLRPESAGAGDTITSWPQGFDMYLPPDEFADKSSGAPGREFWILAGGVVPNVGTTSYSGLVNLDIRHVSAPPLEYYNGIDAGTQSNTLKDYAEWYIRYGYNGGIPVPGEQVAMYNGTSAAFSPQALQETYRVGDTIAVIVYNGHVFGAPNLAMTGDSPNHKVTYPTTSTVTTSALTYTISLEALNGFQSAPGGITMGVQGLEGFADVSLSSWSPVLGRDGFPKQKALQLTVTPRISTTTIGTTTHTYVVTGTRKFYVSAYDNLAGGTKIRRYWAGIASIGDSITDPISGTLVQRDKPAVTCFPTNADQNYPFIATVKGQQAQFELKLDLWGVPGTLQATVSSGALPSGLEWVKAPPLSRDVDPTKHPGAKLRLNIKVNDTVTTDVVHPIPLTISAPGIPEAGSCELYILVEEAGATVNDYVEILGYAALEIMGYYNSGNLIDPLNPNPANAVRGRIVSELMSSPPDLTYGLRARLIPWE